MCNLPRAKTGLLLQRGMASEQLKNGKHHSTFFFVTIFMEINFYSFKLQENTMYRKLENLKKINHIQYSRLVRVQENEHVLSVGGNAGFYMPCYHSTFIHC